VGFPVLQKKNIRVTQWKGKDEILMQTFKEAVIFSGDIADSTAIKKSPTLLKMPATTLIQNLYARSPEEQDVAIAEALAKEDSFPAETPIKETAGKRIGLMWPRTFSTTLRTGTQQVCK